MELIGKENTAEAMKKWQKSIEITHEMAFELIKRYREIKVDCLVAPYEADAQLGSQ